MSSAKTRWSHPDQRPKQRMNLRRVSFVLPILATTWLLPTGATAQTAGSGSGYYTAAQAAAGGTTFGQVCAICHGDHLQGNVGPALAGKQFLSVSQFQGLTAWFLYDFMSTHMPQNAPGSLTKAQYNDLMAFILKANGYPSGSAALTGNEDRLKAIKIAPQAGK